MTQLVGHHRQASAHKNDVDSQSLGTMSRRGPRLGGPPFLGTVTSRVKSRDNFLVILHQRFDLQALGLSPYKCFSNIDLYKDDVTQYFISVEMPMYVMIYLMQNSLSFDFLKL